MYPEKIIIGTRGSQLALWQANWIKELIEGLEQNITVTLTIIKTSGDKIQDVPLNKVGGKGLFVKEIEEALVRREVDIAVHSMKDVPMKLPYELCIGCITERESPLDALLSKTGKSLAELQQGARVGTSSLRRSSQLLAYRPDLEIIPLRGNIDTRIGKLDNGELDAIILASAGLDRMGWSDRITERIDPKIILPAMGQGAVGIECRKHDLETMAVIGQLDHEASQLAVEAERAFVGVLEGGCQIPIGAYAQIHEGKLKLEGLVASLDGKNIIHERIEGPCFNARSLGVQLGHIVLEKGADKILDAIVHP
jgi:hydroxymethylbilane synthase